MLLGVTFWHFYFQNTFVFRKWTMSVMSIKMQWHLCDRWSLCLLGVMMHTQSIQYSVVKDYLQPMMRLFNSILLKYCQWLSLWVSHSPSRLKVCGYLCAPQRIVFALSPFLALPNNSMPSISPGFPLGKPSAVLQSPITVHREWSHS